MDAPRRRKGFDRQEHHRSQREEDRGPEGDRPLLLPPADPEPGGPVAVRHPVREPSARRRPHGARTRAGRRMVRPGSAHGRERASSGEQAHLSQQGLQHVRVPERPRGLRQEVSRDHEDAHPSLRAGQAVDRRSPGRRREDPRRRSPARCGRREARAERADELQGQRRARRHRGRGPEGGRADHQGRAAREPRRQRRSGGDRSDRRQLCEGGHQVTAPLLSLTRATAARSIGRRWPSALPWILPVAILTLWWGSVSLGIFAAYQLPPPPTVLDAAIALWRRGLLVPDAVATIGRVFIGFAIGSLLAIALGTLTRASRRVEHALEATPQALPTVPTLAWAPFLLLWLG